MRHRDYRWRWLCWLGIHTWAVSAGRGWVTRHAGRGDQVLYHYKTRRCTRCGHTERKELPR